MEQQLHRTYEWTKSKQKQNQLMSRSNLLGVLLFDLSHKQCNGIINGWLQCLTSEWKGRFLVNNILMFGTAWCLVMAQIQFFFIKIIKDGTSRTLAAPHPPASDNISFMSYQKMDVICVSPLTSLWNTSFAEWKWSVANDI